MDKLELREWWVGLAFKLKLKYINKYIHTREIKKCITYEQVEYIYNKINYGKT